jgi:hypothetical protein
LIIDVVLNNPDNTYLEKLVKYRLK